MKEKRKFTRLSRPQITLAVRDAENFSKVYVENLSRGGIAIATNKTYPENSKIDIEIEPPDLSLTISLSGEVQRIIRDKNTQAPVGMAVEFTDVTPEQDKILKKLIERYREYQEGQEAFRRPSNLRDILYSICFCGLRHTIGSLLCRPHRYDSYDFDKKFGTDTRDFVPQADLGFPAQESAVQYEPTNNRVAHHIIKSLPIDYFEFTFVDVGAGKGRVSLIASNFPFREIIGIEASPSLVDIARKNRDIFDSPAQKCKNVSFRCLDIRNFEIPKGKTIFFLFNPFYIDVLASFLRNLETPFSENPRESYLIYLNPTMNQRALLASPLLTLVDRVTLFHHIWSWEVHKICSSVSHQS